MDKIKLSTDRLILQAPTLADVNAITAAFQDPELQRRVPIPVPYGVVAIRDSRRPCRRP
ncbi:MAG: hypothetical protein H7201_01440 [Candidatus Saccharibacteria bacterium]|nr:hypothetical protein [Microbacteriaceae bacterium]